MSLEVYTGLIKDLVITNPTPTDPKSQGDDHLRGIKKTMVEDCVRVSTAGFCKNKLFNGEVTRINQREFDGNWSTKNIWSGGNTIEQQELCYGYDMWAKASATDMVQPIEAGNFRPSTVHTISGLNMTTRQETSPASGNWNIVVPQAARNVQVEEGTVATPFEIRPISFEFAQCQRYLLQDRPKMVGTGSNSSTSVWRIGFMLPVAMRVNPQVKILGAIDLQCGINTAELTGVGANYSNTVAVEIDGTTTINAFSPGQCVVSTSTQGGINVSAVI